MLKKLLKYEFKSVSKILTPLLLGTLALAVITAVLFTINYRVLDTGDTDSYLNNIFTLAMTTFLVFSIIAIVASIFVMFVILLNRYYKNFFGDEGYLTFTLPAQTKSHLFTKLTSGVVWTILSGVVVIVSGFLLAIFGTASNGEIINSEIYDELCYGFEIISDYLGSKNLMIYIIEFILFILIITSYQLLVFYLAITIGSIITKKHKVLASIGVYLGISSVSGMIMNIMIYIIFSADDLKMNDMEALFTTSHFNIFAILVLYTAMAAVAFIINNTLLHKKLNLE
ncbi:MAG: hypothetical protein A2Y15_06765 [Clostridiales bacterium GWF2_36_10]|nr:MAG: hypothetical protein A2Y15_06765 [Clostridiales bacterium GWF2_36_10]HAN21213.1 hypothetical protein [Clostridiales bacterium]